MRSQDRFREPLGVMTIIAAIAVLLLAACGGSAAPTATPIPATQPVPSPTPMVARPATSGTPAAVPTASPTPTLGTTTPTPAGQAQAGLVLRIVPDQSEARYRVREQLLGRSLPNDAVGRTQAIEGQIVFTPDGAIDSAQSRVTVDLTTLRSDEARRDNYIKQNTLEVARFPKAEFQPTAARGLPWPLPPSGEFNFQLEGNLTIHGTTEPVVWDVRATVDGSRITGTATTTVTFADFGLTQPRVPIVLSVEESIALELDFTVEPES